MSQSAVHTTLDELAPVTLDELNAVAALQTRVDRKYVLTPSGVDSLLERLDHDVRVLDVDSRRRFAYESVYFDTPELGSYRVGSFEIEVTSTSAPLAMRSG